MTDMPDFLSPNLPLHIVLLDDDVDDAFFLNKAIERLQLSKQGVDVDFKHFEDPHALLEGLAQVSTENLLLMIDIKMPKMDGYEVIRRIRTMPRLNEVPIFVYSSSANTPLIDEAIAAGAKLGIEKALSIDEIAKQMDRALKTL